jgi:hypothetical protein
LRARAFEETQRETPKLLAVTRADAPPVADGDLTDWQGREFVSWQASSGSARAALAYDDATLYLAYEVGDATPMVNKGSDWRLLFKTGDAVDVELGADPTADPQRRSAVPGDLRLLISAQDDGAGLKPVVVIYRHRMPGAPDAQKTTFSSPWRSEVIDQVTRLEGAQVAVRPVPGERRTLVEAAIPLAALGLKSSPGLRLSGDFGALFGDAAGEVTIERSHWSNHSVNFTADVPGEAMAYPDLRGTLEFR